LREGYLQRRNLSLFQERYAYKEENLQACKRYTYKEEDLLAYFTRGIPTKKKKKLQAYFEATIYLQRKRKKSKPILRLQ
jgi:hypothetical protein